MIVKLFPDIQEVFNTNHSELKEYFFPICSVNLKTVNKEYNEIIHFLHFNEDPYNLERVKYFNHYCKDYTVGFKVKDGKYELLTDIKFMYVSQEWEQWLAVTKNTYQDTKNRFLTKRSEINYNSFITIGGKPKWIQQPETPLSIDGKKLHFVGHFYSSDFVKDSGGKDIYIFYNPQEKIIIHIYQIT